AAFTLNFGGAVTASTTQSNPVLAQQALEALAGVGPGGVVVTGFSGQQQMLVTFTEGAANNLRGLNVPDLAFQSGTGASEVTGTQGGVANTETLGVGAAAPVVTAFVGPNATAGLSIGAGTTLALANDFTLSLRPGAGGSGATGMT